MFSQVVRPSSHTMQQPSSSTSMPPPPPRAPDGLLSRATVTDCSSSSSGDVASSSSPAPLAGGSLLSRATVTDHSAASSSSPPTSGGDDRGLEGFSFPGPTQIASSAASLAAPQPRAKVPQAPQYSQMAWMALGRKRDLTGLNGACPGKLTMEEVKRHSTEEDCWMVLRGKVYNITPYLNFHPGGKRTLMAAAGKDGTKLFDKFHKWVNAEFLMEKCLVGFLE